MRKIFLLILFILLSRHLAIGETSSLILRVGHHPDFLRIVLEGAESVIANAIVNQKAQDILITFPNADFTIQTEDAGIVYKKTRDTILFSPGNFKELKVSTLKHPNRLVIDIYPDTKRTIEKTKFSRINSVVVDPGHGGYEYGLVRAIYQEKNVVLDIAKKLRALVGRSNTQVFLTRESDLFLTLNERAVFTNAKKADIFVSLHMGSHKEIILYAPVITESIPDYVKQYLVNKGQEGFIANTTALIKAIKEAVASEFGDEMVSVRPLPFSILSKIEAAVVMVELPLSEDTSYTEEVKSEMAYIIYKGLHIYEENLTEEMRLRKQ